MQEYMNVIDNLPPIISTSLASLPTVLKERVVEIRLRVGKPLMIATSDKNYFIDRTGQAVSDPSSAKNISFDMLREVVLCISGRAIHSRQSELIKGYITMSGGHRVGVAGVAVVQDGVVSDIKEISSLNIRIAKHRNLPSVEILRTVLSRPMFSLLIVGVPRSGKTTILKSIAKHLSDNQKQVSIVDTRREIAPNPESFYSCCDVLSGYPRGEGMVSAIKSLAPDVIICDEVGDDDDVRAIRSASNAGVNLALSAHADSIATLKTRKVLATLLEGGVFTDIAILNSAKNPGVIKEVVRWN